MEQRSRKNYMKEHVSQEHGLLSVTSKELVKVLKCRSSRWTGVGWGGVWGPLHCDSREWGLVKPGSRMQ